MVKSYPNGLKKKKKTLWGKEEIARYEQFLLFPQCFQNNLYYKHVKKRLVWERVKIHFVKQTTDHDVEIYFELLKIQRKR